MLFTRFSLFDLPDLSDLQRANIPYFARAADFPLLSLSLPLSLSPGLSGPRPLAPLLSWQGPAWQGPDGAQATQRAP